MTELENYQGNPNLKKANQAIEWDANTVKEFIRCSQDPVYFAETYMKIVSLDEGLVNFKLRDYQRDMIRSMKDNRYCAYNLSRQSGKSITVCAFLLWYVIFNESKEVAILANKGDTAREILGRIQLAYQYLPKWLQQGTTVWNKGSFELENGCKIIAAATTSDNVRGHSISICYLDECAFIDNYDEFFASVFPTISSGSETKIIMTSTPKGLNHFYKTVKLGKEGKNGYHVIEVPWHRVPGRDDNWKKKTLEALNGDEEKFDQEFNIQFLGSSGTLISSWKLQELLEQKPIMKNEDGLRQYKSPIKDRKYAVIVDVARGKGLDYSAFSVIDITSMPYDQVCTFRSNGILVADYADFVYQTARLYNQAYVLVEINDIGVAINRRESADVFADMITDQFDEMIRQCERHPLVMNVSIHPFIMGQPFRLNRLRQALEHCRSHAGAGVCADHHAASDPRQYSRVRRRTAPGGGPHRRCGKSHHAVRQGKWVFQRRHRARAVSGRRHEDDGV